MNILDVYNVNNKNLMFVGLNNLGNQAIFVDEGYNLVGHKYWNNTVDGFTEDRKIALSETTFFKQERIRIPIPREGMQECDIVSLKLHNKTLIAFDSYVIVTLRNKKGFARNEVMSLMILISLLKAHLASGFSWLDSSRFLVTDTYFGKEIQLELGAIYFDERDNSLELLQGYNKITDSVILTATTNKNSNQTIMNLGRFIKYYKKLNYDLVIGEAYPIDYNDIEGILLGSTRLYRSDFGLEKVLVFLDLNNNGAIKYITPSNWIFVLSELNKDSKSQFKLKPSTLSEQTFLFNK